MENQMQFRDEIKIFVEEYVENCDKIDLNEEVIERLSNLGVFYNRLYSESDIGDVIDIESFESTFHIKWYIENDLDFIVRLFANHTKSHHFRNGNKRTANEIFNYFISNYTPFKLDKSIDVEKLQIDLIEGRETIDTFSSLIFKNLIVKKAIATDKVKLEKLIKRGDVKEGSAGNNQIKSGITLSDLKKSDLFFQLLRKPYFQRDTNSWDLSKIDNIISSFTENMLIPSVILWASKNEGIFIVDGAHRLSALASWVNDDYGAELDFTNHLKVKSYIEDKYGNYQDLVSASDQEKKGLLMILATKAINIEWINGDYELVKNSFIRINEQGVKITNDEKEIIKNDNKPIAKLSRAILSYSGGQHSSLQDQDTKEIYNDLFTPSYNKINKIVPVCGSVYDEFIISRIYNLLKVINSNKKYSYTELLNKTKNLVNLMVHDLQLNNRVYFYGVTYKYKQSALIGISMLLLKLQEMDKIDMFIRNREAFEEYLVNYPEHIQKIVRKGRYVKKATQDLENYYYSVLEFVDTGNNSELTSKFGYLSDMVKTKRMNTIEDKFKLEISALNKCKVCGGYINNFETSEVHNICKGVK